MTKKGPGRPPLNGTPQTERIAIRMTKSERQAVLSKARKAGQNVSVYLRERALGDSR